MHMAAAGGFLDIVKYLQDKGSSLHATDKVINIFLTHE